MTALHAHGMNDNLGRVHNLFHVHSPNKSQFRRPTIFSSESVQAMHPQVVQLPTEQNQSRSQIPLSILRHVILLRHLLNCVQLLSQAFLPFVQSKNTTSHHNIDCNWVLFNADRDASHGLVHLKPALIEKRHVNLPSLRCENFGSQLKGTTAGKEISTGKSIYCVSF